MKVTWSDDAKTAMTECPACGNNSLWIRNEGFICTGVRCGWLAGSVLELAVTRAGSLQKAAAKLRYYFPARTEHWASQCLPELEMDYRLKRRLIELLGESNLRRDDDILAPSWHEAMQLSWDLSRKTVFQMRSAQVEEWFKVCKEGYGLKKAAPASQGLIVPYFSSPFDIAGFLFLDPTSKRSHWFQLRDQAWSWAGWMAMLPPSNAPVFVAQSLREALNPGRSESRNIPVLVCHYRPFGLQNGRMPSDKMVLSLDPAKPLLAVPSRLALKCDLRVALSRNGSEYWVTWSVFLREGILKRLGLGESMNDEVVAFIQRCRPSMQVLEEVRDWFLAEHRADVASQLEAEVLDIPICSTKEGEIMQRGGRYVFHDHRTGWASDVTNFAASPEGIVTFPLSRQVFYSLRIELNGKVKEVLCPQGELLSPSNLEPRLMAAFSSEDGGGSAVLPRVESKVHIKTIAEHLITGCARKGERQGVDYCGWSYDKSIFRTPWWMISAERGLVEDKFPLHPDLDSAFVYSHSVSLNPGPSVDLPSPVRSVMRIFLALLARSWRGTGIQQIRVADSPWSREILGCIFKSLGQVRPFSDIGTAEKFSRSCPHYGTELEQGIPSYSKLPLIDLGDTGLFGGETSTIPEGFESMVLSGVRRLVEACISGSPFPEAEKKFLPVNSLLEEGRAWETILWSTKAKPTILYDGVERFFGSVGIEDMKVNVVMDRDTRTLLFPGDLLKVASDPEELAEEFFNVCPGAELTDDGRLEVPAAKIQKMIYEWYGEVPKWKSKSG